MRKYLLYAFLIIVISSFKFKEEFVPISQEVFIVSNEEGLRLMKKNCYSCHSVNSKSYDKIKAPPMESIKLKYKMVYNTKEEFTKAFTKWVLNPTKEKALMGEAIEKYKLMPNLSYYEDDIIIIAEYIYTNELEKPIWFDSIYKNK